MRKQLDKSDPGAVIAQIAARQHGVISVAQLRLAGLSPASVTRQVAAARLHHIHRGVYSVGHPGLSKQGRWMAAVLACGEGAVLSHRSAAELWGIRRPVRRRSMAGGRAEVEHIEVTVPRVNGLVQRAGVATHRSATLTPDDCTRRHGIPVTKPARTLTDLRRVVSPVEFAKAVREAEFLQLQAGDRSGIEPVRSELENTFFQLCRRHRLPKPAVNEHVARYVVDFLWRDARLIAEVDGWESHRTRSAFEDDRARDAALALLGYRIVRFTWRQINADAGRVGKTIRDLLRGE